MGPKIFVFLSVGLVGWGGNATASKINKSAQALSNHLRPVALAKKFDGKEPSKSKQQLVRIIEALEDTKRTNGPDPESLLRKALDFREDIGDWEKMLITNAAMTAWRDAHAMGLFDENGQFQPTITRGRGVGDPVVFERIVPGESLAAVSNQVSNLRIVRKESARVVDENPTPREIASKAQIEGLVRERTEREKQLKFRNGPPTNQLGQTEKEEKKLWELAVSQAGESADNLPRIRISAGIGSSPSHKTKDRWRFVCEILNHSTHPTEVTVRTWLMGVTEKKRQHYIMAKEERAIRLRPNESKSLEFYTQPKKSYKNRADDYDGLSKDERKKSDVHYRGYAVQVVHEKGIAAFEASDQTYLRMMDPEDEDMTITGLPEFRTD